MLKSHACAVIASFQQFTKSLFEQDLQEKAEKQKQAAAENAKAKSAEFVMDSDEELIEGDIASSSEPEDANAESEVCSSGSI